jgi:hypothetical protein
MISRLSRIKNEFGMKMLLRVVLLLVGLVGMSLIGWFALGSLWPAGISIVGLLIGWLLRRAIVDHGESLTWALPVSMAIYGIVLFIGERLLGIPRDLQLLIITLTTVAVFNIQFWWLSDPLVINVKNDRRVSG